MLPYQMPTRPRSTEGLVMRGRPSLGADRSARGSPAWYGLPAGVDDADGVCRRCRRPGSARARSGPASSRRPGWRTFERVQPRERRGRGGRLPLGGSAAGGREGARRRSKGDRGRRRALGPGGRVRAGAWRARRRVVSGTPRPRGVRSRRSPRPRRRGAAASRPRRERAISTITPTMAARTVTAMASSQ